MMSLLQDDYSHASPDLFYTPTNIPGPGCSLDNFNDYASGCDCTTNCQDTCCHQAAYGLNYNCGRLQRLTAAAAVGSGRRRFDLPVVECNPCCNCQPSRCTNRVVQLGPSPDLKIVEFPLKGHGLMSTSRLLAGQFVCEYAGEIIGEAAARARLAEQETRRAPNYILVVREHLHSQQRPLTTIVDPTLIGNIGRYLNHSCEPNLELVPVRSSSPLPHLALFARKDIGVGEELCFDYGSSLGYPLDNNTHLETGGVMTSGRTLCYCGSLACRRFLPYEKSLFE